MSESVQKASREEAFAVARLLSHLLLLVVSGILFLEARAIPTSRFEVLGAGAFPMLVHGALMALLALAIVTTLRRVPLAAYGRVAGGAADWAYRRRLVFIVFGCLALYLWAMPRIGFSIATFAFLIVLQATLAPKTPKAIAVALALSVIFSFGLNWLFAEVFNVFLPRGL